MKVLLLCALLIASVYANSEYQQAAELIQRHLKVPALHENVQGLVTSAHSSLRGLQERAAPSGDCLIALGSALNAGCFPNVTETFDPAAAPICTSTCDAAFAEIFTRCQGSFNSDEVSGYTFWRSVLCAKVGDTFCYATFQDLPKEGATLTQQNLESICSPCFAKLLNIIRTYAGAAANPFDNEDVFFFFDLVCTKSPSGEFCIIEFQNNGGEPLPACMNTGFGDLSFTVQCLDSFCEDGCTRRLLTKVYLKYGNTPEGAALKIFRQYLCSKNPKNDKYCLIAWSEVTSAGPPADCTATRNIAGTLGCCLGSFYQILIAASNDTASLIDQAAATCSVDIPDPCAKPPSGSIIGKIVVSIKYAWASANIPELKEALKADLAAFFGVSPDDVDITGVADFSGKRAGTGTSVSFSASGDDSASTKALADQLNNQGSSIVFGETSALYGSENPGQTVEVQSVSAEYNSASAIGVSMLALVAALLVLLY